MFDFLRLDEDDYDPLSGDTEEFLTPLDSAIETIDAHEMVYVFVPYWEDPADDDGLLLSDLRRDQDHGGAD